MTEKSEDQVVWVSEDTLKDSIGVSRTDLPEHIHPSVRSTYLAYVPHSKYLALKSDLENAVEIITYVKERLKENEIKPGTQAVLILSLNEALGKIGGE